LDWGFAFDIVKNRNADSSPVLGFKVEGYGLRVLVLKKSDLEALLAHGNTFSSTPLFGFVGAWLRVRHCEEHER
jgi:hypothetical protein